MLEQVLFVITEKKMSLCQKTPNKSRNYHNHNHKSNYFWIILREQEHIIMPLVACLYLYLDLII